MRLIWHDSEKRKSDIEIYRMTRGCIEAPILFILQVWLVTYGEFNNESFWTQISFSDWEGNTFTCPYLRLLSIVFSFIAIIRARTSLEKSDFWLQNLPMLVSSIYFHLGSIIISLTYLNTLALMAPTFVLLTNIVSRLLVEESTGSAEAVILSLIATFLPLNETFGLYEIVLKTLLYATNLTLVLIIINSPYESILFIYGQHTIFGNFQVNVLVATLLLTAFLSLFSMTPPRICKKSPMILSLINFTAICFAISVLCSQNLDSRKYAFISVKPSVNHTKSIKGLLIEGHFPNDIKCGILHSPGKMSQIETTKYGKEVLKIQSKSELSLALENMRHVKLAVVRMDHPYLPANPIDYYMEILSMPEETKVSFDILLLTPEDWKLVNDFGF